MLTVAAGRPADAVVTAAFRLIIRDNTRVSEIGAEWREDPYRIQGDADYVAQVLRGYILVGAAWLIVQMPAAFDFLTLERLAGMRSSLARAPAT